MSSGCGGMFQSAEFGYLWLLGSLSSLFESRFAGPVNNKQF